MFVNIVSAFWMLSIFHHVFSSEVVPETKQPEYRSSRFSVGFHVLLPVAGLILVALGRKQIFEKIINQLDKRCLTVFCPRFIKKEALVKWASGRLPPTWSSHYTKTLSGGIQDLWTDGSLLCTLINASVPGACPNPHRHWRKPPVHAQAMAYKYFSVIPVFTNEDLQKPLNSQLERKFVAYLSEIQKSFNKISETSEKENKITERYIVRGMGVFSGEQHKMAEFYIYLDENCDNDNESNIIIQIRGPFGSFGEAISPKLINKKRKYRRKVKPERRSSIKLIENLQSLQWNFSRNQKKAPTEEIEVEATLDNDRIKVCYIPKNYGMYEINMIAGGEVLKGSPFNVHIFVNEKNADEVSLQRLKHSRTIRKVINSSDEAIPSTNSHDTIHEEKQLTPKSSFNFKEVVNEITKHGSVFKNLLDDENYVYAESTARKRDTDGVSIVDTKACDPIHTSKKIESNGKHQLDVENYKCEAEASITTINENKSDTYLNEPVILPIDREPNLKNSIKKNVDRLPITSSETHTEYNNISECVDKFIINEIYLKEKNKMEFDSLEKVTISGNNTEKINLDKLDSKATSQNITENENTYSHTKNDNRNAKKQTDDIIGSEYRMKKEKIFEDDREINKTKNNETYENSTENSYRNIAQFNIYNFKAKYNENNSNQVKLNFVANSEIPSARDIIENGTKKIEHTNNDLETNSRYKNNLEFSTNNSVKAQNIELRFKNRNIIEKVAFNDGKQSDESKKSELNNNNEVIKTSHNSLVTTNNVYTYQDNEKKLTNSVQYNAEQESTQNKSEENGKMKDNELSYKLKIFFNNNPSKNDKNDVHNNSVIANSPNSSANSCTLNKQISNFKVNNARYEPIFTNKQQMAATDNKQLDHNKCMSYVCQPRYMENVNVNKVKIPERFIDPPTKNCVYRLDDKYFKNILNESNKVTNGDPLDKTEICDIYAVDDISIKNKTSNDCFEHCDKYETDKNSIKNRIQMYLEKLEPNSSPNNYKIVSKDTSPICPDHIVSEVVGTKKSVAERRKIFAQSSVESELTSKNSSFSDNESSLGSSIKKFKIEDLTVLNSLSDPATSPNEAWSLCSTVSMPNLSFESDWSPTNAFRDKKFFWENISSRSSSSISNKSLSPKKINRALTDLDRSKLIWTKPDSSVNVDKNYEENETYRGNMFKSADDILSMTENLTPQHKKRFQSVNDSLNTCTVLSIEERKKMLLKQAYENEREIKEKLKQRKKLEINNQLKDKPQDKAKESVRYSQISEKIERYNRASKLSTQEKKPTIPSELRKTKSFHVGTAPEQTEGSDTPRNREFKEVIKYFKNLEKQSQNVKPKATNFHNDLDDLKPSARYRTGSLNLSNVSEKFSVHNLYDDVFGHNKGSFKGTPNRSALVEALATFTRNPSMFDRSEDTEDNIHYELFKHVKRRRRKSLKSIFDIYY